MACVKMPNSRSIVDLVVGFMKEPPASLRGSQLRPQVPQQGFPVQPWSFYCWLMQLCKYKCDRNKVRTVFVSNIKREKMGELRQTVAKLGTVTNFLPLLDEAFVEFETDADADRLGVYLSLLNRSPSYEVTRMFVPPSDDDPQPPSLVWKAMPDVSDRAPGVAVPQPSLGVRPRSQSPFWVTMTCRPFLFPTVCPWFHIPAFQTLKTKSETTEDFQKVNKSTIMLTNLPRGQYTHEVILSMVQSFLLDRNLHSFYYDVIVLPLQRRAFVNFCADKCAEFAEKYFYNGLWIKNNLIQPHYIDDELFPLSSEEELYNTFMKMSNSRVPEKQLLERRLLCVLVNKVVLDLISLVMEVVASAAPVLGFLPLANRICIELLNESDVTKVKEKLSSFKPKNEQQELMWNRVVSLETAAELNERVKRAGNTVVDPSAFQTSSYHDLGKEEKSSSSSDPQHVSSPPSSRELSAPRARSSSHGKLGESSKSQKDQEEGVHSGESSQSHQDNVAEKQTMEESLEEMDTSQPQTENTKNFKPATRSKRKREEVDSEEVCSKTAKTDDQKSTELKICETLDSVEDQMRSEKAQKDDVPNNNKSVEKDEFVDTSPVSEKSRSGMSSNKENTSSQSRENQSMESQEAKAGGAEETHVAAEGQTRATRQTRSSQRDRSSESLLKGRTPTRRGGTSAPETKQDTSVSKDLLTVDVQEAADPLFGILEAVEEKITPPAKARRGRPRSQPQKSNKTVKEAGHVQESENEAVQIQVEAVKLEEEVVEGQKNASSIAVVQEESSGSLDEIRKKTAVESQARSGSLSDEPSTEAEDIRESETTERTSSRTTRSTRTEKKGRLGEEMSTKRRASRRTETKQESKSDETVELRPGQSETESKTESKDEEQTAHVTVKRRGRPRKQPGQSVPRSAAVLEEMSKNDDDGKLICKDADVVKAPDEPSEDGAFASETVKGKVTVDDDVEEAEDRRRAENVVLQERNVETAEVIENKHSEKPEEESNEGGNAEVPTRQEGDATSVDRQTKTVDEKREERRTEEEENVPELQPLLQKDQPQILEKTPDEAAEETSRSEKRKHGEETDGGDQRTLLPPFRPGRPVGQEYVVPKSGFFCDVCAVFYLNETAAREQHCSSRRHYRNVRKHLEKLSRGSAQS